MTLSKFASLTLFRATPAQVLEARKLRWTHWGGLLTKEQYLKRDAIMDSMEHAVDSRLITWYGYSGLSGNSIVLIPDDSRVLAPRDNPHTLDFMSVCGSYKRRGLVRYLDSREVQEVTCYGLASLFIPQHQRGKGYASHTMRLLHWVTSGRTSEYNLPQFPPQWGAPPPEVAEAGNGLFSVLYSDVGDEIYNRTGPGISNGGGWETRSPISTIWDITGEAVTEQRGIDSEWTLLKYGDLDAFWKKDAQFIRRMMENMPQSSPDYHIEKPKVLVSCLPDAHVAHFHLFRNMFGAENIVPMSVWGIVKKKIDNDQPTFATWSIDMQPLPPTLIITRISAAEAEFPGLLHRIQDIARQGGIYKMEIWNIPKHLLKVAAATGGQTSERKEHRSGLRWYGRGMTVGDVEWVLNEK